MVRWLAWSPTKSPNVHESQLGRDLIRERATGGIRNARENGKKVESPNAVRGPKPDSANQGGRPEPGTDRRKARGRPRKIRLAIRTKKE